MTALSRALRHHRERRHRRDDLAVLASLVLGDQYANAIQRRTGLRWAALYQALARLEQAGLAAPGWGEEWDPPRRVYRPTDTALDTFRRTA